MDRPLQAPGPCANRSVAAAIGMQNRKSIRRPGLGANGDQHTPPTGQRLEDTAVVRLKPHAPNGARNPQLRQIPAAAL